MQAVVVLFRRNCRFCPIRGRDHYQYSCFYPRRDGQAEWARVAGMNTGVTGQSIATSCDQTAMQTIPPEYIIPPGHIIPPKQK